MKRLVLWSLLLTVTISLVITAIILLGEQQPLPNNVALMRFTACELPCWIGIVPGKTPINQAQSILHTVFEPSANFQIDSIGNSPLSFVVSNRMNGFAFGVAFQADPSSSMVDPDNVVGIISLWWAEDTPLSPIKRPILGDLYSILGNPTAVRYQTTSRAMPVLVYPQHGAEIGTGTDFYSHGGALVNRSDFVLNLYSRMPPLDTSLLPPDRFKGFYRTN